MITFVVINLKERNDRLNEFRESWKSFNVEIQDGIKHKMPHTGCGLAHINAIRKGLEKSECCLILEDDCDLIPEKKDEFLNLLNYLFEQRDYFDAVSINPHHDNTPIKNLDELICFNIFDSVYKVSPTWRLIGNHCTVWSKRSLPLINEYEKALLKNDIFLPIDRLMFNDHWCSLDIVTWESCLDVAKFIDQTINVIPKDLKWSQPEVWVVLSKFVKTRDSLSNNTGEINIMPETETLYDVIMSTKLKYIKSKEIRLLDIVEL